MGEHADHTSPRWLLQKYRVYDLLMFSQPTIAAETNLLPERFAVIGFGGVGGGGGGGGGGVCGGVSGGVSGCVSSITVELRSPRRWVGIVSTGERRSGSLLRDPKVSSLVRPDLVSV